MVFRFLILITFLCIKLTYANIIYDKKNILVTDIEIKNYLKIFEQNTGDIISINKALKNIILMKKTINFLKKNNIEYLEYLDEIIKKKYNEINVLSEIEFNYLRLQEIENELIYEYFQNQINIQDIEIIFANLDDLKIPISKNNCLTIEKFHQMNTDKEFIKKFFSYLKNNQIELTTNINNEIYYVCMNSNFFKKIEKELISHIKKKTKKDFNKLIYENLR